MSSLDEKVVLELKGLMGDDYPLVLDAFIRSADQAVAQLTLAVENNDVKLIETITHTLKGSSANIGAKKLSHICSLMVEDARNSMTDNFKAYHDNIILEYGNVNGSIKELLNN